jgi:hypothetical protein
MLPPTGASRLRPLGQRYSTFAVLATLSAGLDAWTPPLALFFPRGRRQERRAGGAWQPAPVPAGSSQCEAPWRLRNSSNDGGRSESVVTCGCGEQAVAIHAGQGGTGEDEGESQHSASAYRREAEARSTSRAHGAAARSRARLPWRHGSAHRRGSAGRQGRRSGPQDGGRPAEAIARSLRRTLESVTRRPAYWCRFANPPWLQETQMSKLRHQ